MPKAPAPVPPDKRGRLVVTSVRINRTARCTVICSEAIQCPSCGHTVPPNTRHECQVEDGVKVIKNVLEDAFR